MLNRKYSPKQWVCLVVLSVGVALAVLGEKKDTTTPSNDRPVQSMGVGLVAVTIACFCSALAGVYFEKVLKTNTNDTDGASRAPVSMWMRNIQLSFFSIVIAFCQTLTQSSTDDEDAAKPYLHGFNMWVWTLVALQAGGGLLVAAVIKYADNVLKGLATGVSVVVATGFSAIFFATALSGQFSVGAVMILFAVYFFSNDVPKCIAGATAVSSSSSKTAEMAPMLPR
jgi:solute carrier family 35 (UDP-sugar transporter), member A1/2/3